MNLPLPSQIQIFKSVFKSREDVFATRWEKGNKNGYAPAIVYDPYFNRTHKTKGGILENNEDKTYLPLTETEIEKHLKGEKLIGIYPLLKDNTSWFLAADFDKANWIEECRAFIDACSKQGIKAYLERSRSGKGGHVWIFFEQPYLALKSRKIFISILEQAGIFSAFDKNSSFDRLFPNQDFLSGKGFGNLIALPLFKTTFDQGNSCFIDIDSLKPLDDQWTFLKNIQFTSSKQLDTVYESLSISVLPILNTLPTLKMDIGKLAISLSNIVKMNRNKIPLLLINLLKEELNFANTEFIIKKKIGKTTFGTERYFKLIEETESEIIIPRGFVGRLLRFCKEHKIEYNFHDERTKLTEISFSFNAILRGYQQPVIDAVSKKDVGVIVAPPGSGKTIMGLHIIAQKKQPALIITHRKQIAEQWIERIETFLGIPRRDIGTIGQGKTKIGKQITVAMIQSLSKELEKPNSNWINAFGTIIVDECHHIPSNMFRHAIAKLHTFYLYGLTATPIRKYNDEKLIFIHLGEVIAEIKSEDISTAQNPKIIIRNTELDVPFNSKTDKFETLSKILIHDSERNKLILEDVKKELVAGKKVVIITERNEHIDALYQYLKQSHETIILRGEDSESSRSAKWKTLKEGNYQVLITTGQFFGEGSDLRNANCLFLVYPFSFEGKLIQYIGRVQRSEVTPTIYDYRDIKIDYLNKLFLKRNTYYRKIDRQATLFDEPIDAEEVIIESKKVLTIERKIKIPFEKLEFRYGGIAFKCDVVELNTEIEFEIENFDIRPELEVLKTYFMKTLKLKNLEISIQAEFEDGKLMSQLAISTDLERINNEVIEGVKFSFISKDIFNKSKTDAKSNLLDIAQLQGSKRGEPSLYDSGEELLSDILKGKNYKHSKHLMYLAQKHDSQILKIRFVLSPFSFVFLLTGEEQFHIVLETLDTEEATYIWHIPKDIQSLKTTLKEIDEQLSIIKNKGRQVFLETQPKDFNRITHDYADEKRGFIIWKGFIEEYIV
jgi:superfamily II DNA or RNA helicase